MSYRKSLEAFLRDYLPGVPEDKRGVALLKYHFVQLGVPAQEVAEHTGCDPGYVSRVFNGGKNIHTSGDTDSAKVFQAVVGLMRERGVPEADIAQLIEVVETSYATHRKAIREARGHRAAAQFAVNAATPVTADSRSLPEFREHLQGIDANQRGVALLNYHFLQSGISLQDLAERAGDTPEDVHHVLNNREIINTSGADNCSGRTLQAVIGLMRERGAPEVNIAELEEVIEASNEVIREARRDRQAKHARLKAEAVTPETAQAVGVSGGRGVVEPEASRRQLRVDEEPTPSQKDPASRTRPQERHGNIQL